MGGGGKAFGLLAAGLLFLTACELRQAGEIPLPAAMLDAAAPVQTATATAVTPEPKNTASLPSPVDPGDPEALIAGPAEVAVADAKPAPAAAAAAAPSPSAPANRAAESADSRPVAPEPAEPVTPAAFEPDEAVEPKAAQSPDFTEMPSGTEPAVPIDPPTLDLRASIDPVEGAAITDPAFEQPSATLRNAARSPRPIRAPHSDGSCECPYDLSAEGQACGHLSDWSKPDFSNPACYADVLGDLDDPACLAPPPSTAVDGLLTRFCPRA